MVEQNANQQEAPPNAARVLAGLIAGRIVHFVMKDGRHRPLVVVEPWEGKGSVNGVLLFDGANDAHNFPEGGFFAPPENLRSCLAWATSVPFNDAGGPGTWHWPPRAEVVAAAVDPAALRTQLEALTAEAVGREREDWLQTVNAKIAAFDDYLKKSIEAAEQRIGKLIEDGFPMMVRGPLRPPAAAPPAENVHPHPGKCAVDGCGREYGDNIHHVTRAKHHTFKDPAPADAAAASASEV